MVNEAINLSGIIHGYLIAMDRHKQAQMCLHSDPKCYERISMKYGILAILLPYLLTDMFGQAQQKPVYSYSFAPLAEMLRILWRINLSQYYSFSFDHFMVAIASQYGCHIDQRSCTASHIIITSDFAHHIIV